MNAVATNTIFKNLAACKRFDDRFLDTADERNISLLDAEVPLRGASHAEVVRYTVEIPMRYAECFGVLANGSKVPLENKRQFLAWSGSDEQRALLFEACGRRIETRVDAADNGKRRFIAIDGAVFA